MTNEVKTEGYPERAEADFTMHHMTSPHPGEVTRVTPAEQQRADKNQELMDIIHKGIAPLSMQVKRQVLGAIRQREFLMRR